MDCPVAFRFSASAFASTLLDWWTLPDPGAGAAMGERCSQPQPYPSPTAVDVALFDGWSCAARPTASAPCRLELDCPATWIGLLPHPHRELPPAAWSMFWPVRLMFPASAFESTLLDWWTLPDPDEGATREGSHPHP